MAPDPVTSVILLTRRGYPHPVVLVQEHRFEIVRALQLPYISLPEYGPYQIRTQRVIVAI